MRVIVVEPGSGEPRIVERPRPEPGPDEVLVRTLRVGIDGTDREVVDGGHGSAPPDADEIVLGHEAVGVVEAVGSSVAPGPQESGTEPGRVGGVEEGTVVVPLVRRPPDGTNRYFERGEPDMAPEGAFVERGIVGADGFMTEYFTSEPAYLVAIPYELAGVGFLVEPFSIVEKALEHAEASRSAFHWDPETALVLGNGSLGLTTLAVLEHVHDYDRTYCVGRRDRPDPTIELIESVGGTYVDSRTTAVAEIPAEYEPADLVVEATGYARHAFETVEALAPGGVGVLLGVPENWTFEVDGGRLHRSLVVENRALVGCVNSNRRHFEAAIETVSALPPSFLEDLITGIYDPDEVDSALADDDTSIKTAVEFSDR